MLPAAGVPKAKPPVAAVALLAWLPKLNEPWVFEAAGAAAPKVNPPPGAAAVELGIPNVVAVTAPVTAPVGFCVPNEKPVLAACPKLKPPLILSEWRGELASEQNGHFLAVAFLAGRE